MADEDLVRIVTGDGRKGRSFEGRMLGYVECNSFLRKSLHGVITPLWAVIATTQDMARMLAYNLRGGYDAHMGDKPLCFPEKERYEMAFQQVGQPGEDEASTLINIYQPTAFETDPGAVTSDSCDFCCLIGKAQASAAAWDREAIRKHLKGFNMELDDVMLDLLPWFAMSLERRSRFPMINDLKFYAQMMYAVSIHNGMGLTDRNLTTEITCKASGLERLGMLPALFMSMSHEELGEICSGQVSLFVKKGGKING